MLRIITNNDSKLSVWIENKIYIIEKNNCLHVNTNFLDSYHKFGNDKNYINTKYNIHYKSFLEIYKLVVNYNKFDEVKEKRWSDVTKSNILFK